MCVCVCLCVCTRVCVCWYVGAYIYLTCLIQAGCNTRLILKRNSAGINSVFFHLNRYALSMFKKKQSAPKFIYCCGWDIWIPAFNKNISIKGKTHDLVQNLIPFSQDDNHNSKRSFTVHGRIHIHINSFKCQIICLCTWLVIYLISVGLAELASISWDRTDALVIRIAWCLLDDWTLDYK